MKAYCTLSFYISIFYQLAGAFNSFMLNITQMKRKVQYSDCHFMVALVTLSGSIPGSSQANC